MIVYAGKQYWNKFNNWDEALFQDANRPRDNDMFKLRPWLQSDKWNLRDANKNIVTHATELLVKWIVKASAASAIPSWFSIPYLQETYTADDLSAFNGYVPAGWSAWGSSDLNDFAKRLWQLKYGDPWCKIKDGNVEITNTGTFIIQAFGQYKFPNGYYTTNSYIYQEHVALLKKSKNWWVIMNKNQARACWVDDQLLTWQVGWFNAGEVFNVGVAHTYSSETVMIWCLNLQRLW